MALLAGFQGQRQWTDFYPNGDFTEAILNSSFDWNGIRAPYILATENDALNGVSMLFGHLLTHAASIFADVRTYWSPESVERVTGKKLTGQAAGGIIHLINSGAAALDGCGCQTDADGQPAMKPFWEISEAEAQACLDATVWVPGQPGVFPGRWFFVEIPYPRGYALYDGSVESGSKISAGASNRRRVERGTGP